MPGQARDNKTLNTFNEIRYENDSNTIVIKATGADGSIREFRVALHDWPKALA